MYLWALYCSPFVLHSHTNVHVLTAPAVATPPSGSSKTETAGDEAANDIPRPTFDLPPELVRFRDGSPPKFPNVADGLSSSQSSGRSSFSSRSLPSSGEHKGTLTGKIAYGLDVTVPPATCALMSHCRT